jgi:RNA polymerase sigma factor (sigma-70 family)
MGVGQGEGARLVQRELVERAQRGDQEAFAALAHLSADRLYAIAYRILRDPERANDALQQALLEIWDDLPTMRDVDRFDAWTYRLVIRASYHEAQRERRWTARIRRIPDAADAPDPDPASLIADRDELERGFRALSAEHRAVLVLRYYVGLPVTEIAETLGIPAGTAGSRLHYATRSLRAALEADARRVVAWRHAG